MSPGARANREPTTTALPWAKWYPLQLLGNVIAHGLTFEDVGLLYVLRALQDANDGLPVSLSEIRAMLPRRVAAKRLQGVLDLYFPVAPTGDYRRDEQFHQERVEAREAHAVKVQAGRDGAAKRWGVQQATDAAAASDQEDGASLAAPRGSQARLPSSRAERQSNSSPNGTASSSANGTASGRTSLGASGNQKKKENQNHNQTSTPPPDSSPSSVVGARATSAEVPPLDRLLQRLTTSADQLAIRAFLERCPEQEQLAWTQRLAGYLQGMGFPAGMQPTPEQLALACSDYSITPPSPVHFRAFILRLMRGGKTRSAPRGKVSIEEQYEAGLRWAERGRRVDAGL